MLRTHTCGELRKKDKNSEVTLCGWVDSIRSHGNLTFIDLRDRYGVTQIVLGEELKDSASQVKNEYVLKVSGKVLAKPEPNKKLETGEIEVKINEFEILNTAKVLPLDIHDYTRMTEDTRLTHRFLDLRRKKMQKNLILRHKVHKAIRDFFDKNNFLELETPFLAKSTPEGARDYLVPSRVEKGNFYALPQSPQIFKQLYMIAGYDRYAQIVKCFRDEDLRADRQPEFTQIDVEMSFVEQEDVFEMVEGLIKQVWKQGLGVDVKVPFKRLTYEEAMSKYGSDKPDIRFGHELIDITELIHRSDFKILKSAKFCKCIVFSGEYSRKQIDKLTEVVKIFGAKGLVHAIVGEGIEGQLGKFLDEALGKELIKIVGGKKGDNLFIVAGETNVVNPSLGALRLHLAKEQRLLRDEFNFVWVYDFPLFEWSEEEKRWVSMHHPFTSAKEEDLQYLEDNPGMVRSNGYDLTLNGVEIAGGSIRNHHRDVQERMFTALGLSKSEYAEKFGFLLAALDYGAPPHGGIAFGLDRMVAIMAGEESIRDVIPFPKNKDAKDLMMGAPSEVSKEQLDELGLKLK